MNQIKLSDEALLKIMKYCMKTSVPRIAEKKKLKV